MRTGLQAPAAVCRAERHSKLLAVAAAAPAAAAPVAAAASASAAPAAAAPHTLAAAPEFGVSGAVVAASRCLAKERRWGTATGALRRVVALIAAVGDVLGAG
eukprot:1138308-Pelagomonas_calceolata.AAC.2